MDIYHLHYKYKLVFIAHIFKFRQKHPLQANAKMFQLYEMKRNNTQIYIRSSFHGNYFKERKSNSGFKNLQRDFFQV